MERALTQVQSVPNFKDVLNNGDGDGDKISSLPNDILIHILSFLPTEEAVKTAILSSNWRDLWTFLTTLHLDSESSYLDFPNYVNNIFLLRDHNLPIHKFILCSCDDCDRDSYTITWICAAINQGVQHLNLKIFSNFRYSHLMLPRKFYGCRTLVYLELAQDILVDLRFINLKSSTFLPNLKILSLTYVQFSDNESAAKLISCCQVLEELIIVRHIDDGVENFCVCAPKLKRFEWCYKGQKGFYRYDFVLGVFAPSLEYLYLEDDVSDYIVLKPSSLLIEAQLVLSKFPTRGTTKSLAGITDNDIPLFQNLKHLKYIVDSRKWALLHQLVENAPNLKHFEFDSEYWCKDVPCWKTPNSVPSWFLSCLESVEIKLPYKMAEFNDLLKFMDFLKCFLKKARVLKKMEISYFGKADPTFENELLMFPRVSYACQIRFKILKLTT